MSIINDALKKVQDNLNPKTDAAPVNTPTPSTDQNPSAYIYETPPNQVENLPPANKQVINEQKPLIQNKFKTILAIAFAVLITGACALFIWQQFQTNMPKVQTFAQKSFYQIIHKAPPAPKPKIPEKLESLAQVTINPSTTKSLGTVKPAPITLDIHGIMANDKGNLVLINDQVYQEGDTIDGAKIIKINLDSIKIDNNGEEQTIFVKD